MFNFHHQSKKKKKFIPSQVRPGELVDPILYVGGLDEEKYPRLSQKEDDNIKKKDVENPLNKR